MAKNLGNWNLIYFSISSIISIFRRQMYETSLRLKFKNITINY